MQPPNCSKRQLRLLVRRRDQLQKLNLLSGSSAERRQVRRWTARAGLARFLALSAYLTIMQSDLKQLLMQAGFC